MRTQEEIVNKLHVVKDEDDLLGTITSDLLVYLDFEHAKSFLKPETTKEQWAEIQKPLNKDTLLKQMREYMSFAWDKANGCRGLSAGRTMSHYTAWTWLLGDENVFGDLGDYEYYGKDNLVKLCKYYGWDDLLLLDDGIRSNSEY